MKHTFEDLKKMQSLPLDRKVLITQTRIIEWYQKFNGQVYVSFSGGKDSTVLLHIARAIYPDIPAVFVDTGLEYPEIRQFVKTFDNVTILRPKMRFDEIIRKYGYPIISKEVSECVRQGRIALTCDKYNYRLQKLMGTVLNKEGKKSIYNIEKYRPLLYVDFNISNICCNVMKKAPAHAYDKSSGRFPITAQMAEESDLRKQQWLKNGCNGFDMKSPISNPMSFWTEQDILRFIKESGIKIASVYGDIADASDPAQITLDIGYGCGKLCTTGCKRTGCVFCGFGAHLEKGEGRFQMLKRTHPKLYAYCIGGGEYVDGVWQPNKDGLGMGHVFDELNKIYGEGFIKY